MPLGGKDFARKYLQKFDKTIEDTRVKEDRKSMNEVEDITDISSEITEDKKHE